MIFYDQLQQRSMVMNNVSGCHSQLTVKMTQICTNNNILSSKLFIFIYQSSHCFNSLSINSLTFATKSTTCKLIVEKQMKLIVI